VVPLLIQRLPTPHSRLSKMTIFDTEDVSSESSITSTEEGPGVGLSNPQLSQGRRRMLDLVNRLHTTGYVVVAVSCQSLLSFRYYLFFRVQVDLDLPQIAVIGSQSAGKSSLIESISGVTLPRAAGFYI
jgi:hypothetical protein